MAGQSRWVRFYNFHFVGDGGRWVLARGFAGMIHQNKVTAGGWEWG
jgi:hypothetical protein